MLVLWLVAILRGVSGEAGKKSHPSPSVVLDDWKIFYFLVPKDRYKLSRYDNRLLKVLSGVVLFNVFEIRMWDYTYALKQYDLAKAVNVNRV